VFYTYTSMRYNGEPWSLPGWLIAAFIVAPFVALVAGLVSQKITDRIRRAEEEASRRPPLADDIAPQVGGRECYAFESGGCLTDVDTTGDDDHRPNRKQPINLR
jgi:hypothetical protein